MELCSALVDPTIAVKGWDILPLAAMGFTDKRFGYYLRGKRGYGSPEGTQVDCSRTVVYNNVCYQSRDVNYLMYGLASRLCHDTYGKGLPNAKNIWNSRSLAKRLHQMSAGAVELSDTIKFKAYATALESGLANGSATINRIDSVATLLEQQAFTLQATLEVVRTWKETFWKDKHPAGALHFTECGWNKNAPDKLPPNVAQRCPIDKTNIHKAEYLQWHWLPHLEFN